MFVKHVINQAVSINEDLELLCAMVFHNPNVRSCFINVIKCAEFCSSIAN